MTYAKQFIIDLGRAEGRAEGLAEGLTAALVGRFGPLPDAARSRLARANPAQLKRWLARAGTAPTLARVLGRGK